MSVTDRRVCRQLAAGQATLCGIKRQVGDITLLVSRSTASTLSGMFGAAPHSEAQDWVIASSPSCVVLYERRRQLFYLSPTPQVYCRLAPKVKRP